MCFSQSSRVRVTLMDLEMEDFYNCASSPHSVLQAEAAKAMVALLLVQRVVILLLICLLVELSDFN